MMPIFLWSRLVSQSNQSAFHLPNTVSSVTTVIAPMTTMEAAAVAIAL